MTRSGILLLSAALAGCVFRASDPPRYFRPESIALSQEPAVDADASATAIRLRAVRARPFLRERIVWRTPAEYGMYEQRRWSELPEAYVERALSAALRHTADVGLTDDTRVPALYADVTAFDEVLAPAHVANVAVDVSLTDAGGHRLLERAFSAEAAIAGDDPRSLSRAIGAALDDVSAQVARSVGETLRNGAQTRHRAGGHMSGHPAGSAPRPPAAGPPAD